VWSKTKTALLWNPNITYLYVTFSLNKKRTCGGTSNIIERSEDDVWCDLPPLRHARHKRFFSSGEAPTPMLSNDLRSVHLWKFAVSSDKVSTLRFRCQNKLRFQIKKVISSFLKFGNFFRDWATPRCNFISALELFFFQVGLVHGHSGVSCWESIV
jgi:hypothetical protein